MSEATPHTAHWVQDEAEIAELAALVVDPAREGLVVCVTTQPSIQQPFVDPDLLAQRLGDRAQVWVVTASTHAWALTEALPPKIDVYGGAVRAWQPIPEGKDIYPSDHPQWTVFSADDAPRVIDQVVEYSELAENPPPEFGSEATATVTALRKSGAELKLETGHAAFASNQHLVATGDVYHSREVLNVGQEVQVRVGPWHPQAMRVSVSLRDFAPDPWQRLEEQYRVGAIVEGVVASIQPYGAFVELLPGAEGLLHKSKIADEFVEYVDDFVRPGDRISVRLLSIDGYAHKAEVSMIDVPEGSTPEPLATIFEGGPGWLPDSPDAYADDEDAAQPSSDAGPEVKAWKDDVDGPNDTEAGGDAESLAAEIESLRGLVVGLEHKLAEAERERDALLAQLNGEPEATAVEDFSEAVGTPAVAAAPVDPEVVAEVEAAAVIETEEEAVVETPAADAQLTIDTEQA